MSRTLIFAGLWLLPSFHVKTTKDFTSRNQVIWSNLNSLWIFIDPMCHRHVKNECIYPSHKHLDLADPHATFGIEPCALLPSLLTNPAYHNQIKQNMESNGFDRLFRGVNSQQKNWGFDREDEIEYSNIYVLFESNFKCKLIYMR